MIQNHHRLYSIISSLEKAKISFTLLRNREDAVTIAVAVPGQLWEIDVFEDGNVDVEVFRSDGQIFAYEDLPAMLSKFAD